jgi:integrase
MRTKIRRRKTKGGFRWYVSVVEGGTEYAHGGYRLEREAKEKVWEIVADAKAKGRYVPPSELTVAGYLLGEWVPSRSNADISENSRDVEQIMVRSWILPHIGDVPLQKLAARDLDRLYETLRARGGRGGQPLRGKSVRNTHALLSKALGDAVRRGHLTANPAAAVDPPGRDDSVERAAWSRDEVREFLDVAADDRLHAIWRLVLSTGMRRGELLGLRWPDVDETTITVARQVLLRPDGRDLYVRETTKTRRVRRARVDDSVAAALRSWKVEQATERLAFGPAWRTDGGHRLATEGAWVVTEPNGYIVEPDTLRARFQRLARDAGVPVIPLHGARHTYAELALSAGVRLDVVSRQLGHSSISTTAGNYLHDNDEAAAEAAVRIGEILVSAKGGP